MDRTGIDVVIAGGGPAGAATAIALRRRGIAVTLFDRAAFPRDKVCGDVLLPESRAALRALGLDLTSLKRQAYRCEGVRYVSSEARGVAGDFSDRHGRRRPWWMVRRRDFDAWLIERARQAGATIVEGASVTEVIRDGARISGVRVQPRSGQAFEVRCRVVVGADGASSVVARAVGAFTQRPEHTCLAARGYAQLSLPAPYLEVFTTARALPGCAWIVPVSARHVNVGIGIMQSTANDLGTTPQSMFNEVRAESPLLAERLRHAGPVKLQGWMLPGASERRRLAGPGWVLVGDAGAMVDPFTGHGIHHAIHAGRLAGDSIADAMTSTDPVAHLLRYEAKCRDAFDAEVRRGLMLQRLHASPRVVNAAIKACARHAGLRHLFLALVGHSAPRQALLSPAALVRAAASWSRIVSERARKEGAAA